jgi:hypothetical protein
MEVRGQRHAPSALPPGEETRYPLYRRLVLMGAGNFAPTGIFFFCFNLFLLSFISIVLPFLSLEYLYILCPHVTHSYTTHNTNMHALGGSFFFCILLYCLYFIRTLLFVFIVLQFAFCLYLLHTT